ncbi:MAG: hypothetical protein ABJM47_01860 [Lentilitoribacter sp.]
MYIYLAYHGQALSDIATEIGWLVGCMVGGFVGSLVAVWLVGRLSIG